MPKPAEACRLQRAYLLTPLEHPCCRVLWLPFTLIYSIAQVIRELTGKLSLFTYGKGGDSHLIPETEDAGLTHMSCAHLQ